MSCLVRFLVSVLLAFGLPPTWGFCAGALSYTAIVAWEAITRDPPWSVQLTTAVVVTAILSGAIAGSFSGIAAGALLTAPVSRASRLRPAS
ncbi:MAG: hypothetical protein NZ518_02755 [Dehalococcoidia bacterium]|nr:hypothetical protein [Dehalococcoidia bacterium]